MDSQGKFAMAPLIFFAPPLILIVALIFRSCYSHLLLFCCNLPRDFNSAALQVIFLN
jgi:hypothetical protein